MNNNNNNNNNNKNNNNNNNNNLLNFSSIKPKKRTYTLVRVSRQMIQKLLKPCSHHIKKETYLKGIRKAKTFVCLD